MEALQDFCLLSACGPWSRGLEDEGRLVHSKAKFIEREYKDAGEGGGPEWVAPGVSKFRGFYELFCRTFLSNQGVLSRSNPGFGHVSVCLIG